VQQAQTKSIVSIEGFLFFAILRQPQTSISEHAIAIHQQQLDARCTPFYEGKIFHNLILTE
jgi:hypothetical protein